ncbi:hypothetical protein DFH09DRAFT_1145235 [Mycena vulgaris]|nr:hypothetical protein DFH09DRAFT_1145235 [Mycena vulgaris]
MRIPEELIDAIIGEFDLSENYDSQTQITLQSCALVARSFVRLCQTRLFARISVYDYGQNPTILSHQLATLLESSPHLAAYIRTLDLYHSSDGAETEFVSRILCAVTELHTLILTCTSYKEAFPIDASTLAVFACPSLRRVELLQYRFANVLELQMLLSRSLSLRELSLDEIDFNGDEYGEASTDHASAVEDASSNTVVLKSLALSKMEPLDVELMLESFTTVDITHLQSLSFFVSPITGLLRVNAASLQTVKIGYPCVNFENSDYAEEMDPNILADNQLASLDFESDDLESVLTALPLFGDLANLKALKTIRIALSDNLISDVSGDAFSGDAQWRELDALLAQVRSVGVVEVSIYANVEPETGANRVDPGEGEVVRKGFPLVSENGSLRLHVYPNADCNFRG